MSTIIVDCPATLAASPRPRLLLDGARLHADDAQPRLVNRLGMPAAAAAWRRPTGPAMRGYQAAVQTQDERTAFAGVAYVTATKTTTKQHFSTRSGPPPFRT